MVSEHVYRRVCGDSKKREENGKGRSKERECRKEEVYVDMTTAEVRIGWSGICKGRGRTKRRRRANSA
jgi:hypothetical protein